MGLEWRRHRPVRGGHRLTVIMRVEDQGPLRARDQPTLPSTLGQELTANPFMRCTEPEVVKAASKHAGKPLTDAVSVLGALREWKNSF